MSAAPREVEAGGLYWRVFGHEAGDGEGVESTAVEGNGDPRRSRHGANPLVVLHGLFGAGDNWRGHAEALRKDRLVLVPDLPNHGRSRHTEDMDFRTVARYLWDALSAVSDQLGITASEYAILGHSMGGKVAMAMAFQEPSRTERIISADIAPREYPPSHEEIFEAMDAVTKANIQRRSDADRVMAKRIPTKAIRMFLLKSLVRDDGVGGYRWQLNVEALRRSYGEIRGWPFHEERYAGPVLFIAGGNSPYIQPEDTDTIGVHFPDHRLQTIPEVGHWLHVENRETFLALVTAFLS
ncbi:MAG: alpha/beta fold hydrolase [Alkalispirochaeta sp.]